MAKRLIEAGVNLVQVNLGNNETWDTHGNAFPHLKDKLFPPTDRAVSAFLDDLADRGLLDSTLIVMCAPSLFMLWVLDETEEAIADLRRLLGRR